VRRLVGETRSLEGALEAKKRALYCGRSIDVRAPRITVRAAGFVPAPLSSS
jgi:hypothetical protein